MTLPLRILLPSMIAMLLPLAEGSPGVGPAAAWPAAHAAEARYRVVCDFPCGRLAAEALRAAESAWPLAVETYGAPTAATPSRPLEIYLYRTASSYRAARSGFLRRAPSSLATTDPRTRTAHIAIQSSISDATLERYGLPPTLIRIVAHEAFHLAGLALAPASERYPLWYNEGAASHAEQRALAALGYAAGAAQEPVASTYAWLLQRRLRSGTLPSVESVLLDRLEGVSAQEQYAIRSLLFETVQAAGLAPALDAALRAPTPARRPSELVVRAGLARVVRDHGLDRIEADLHERILAAQPAWTQASRALDAVADGWLQIGLSDDAEAWFVRRWPTGVAATGRVEFLTAAGSIARLLLGTAEEGHLVLEIDAAAGRIRLLRSGGAHDGAQLLATEGATLRERPVKFSLVAANGEIRGEIDGAAPFTLPLDGVTLNGAFGIGAGAASNVVWHDLSVARPF
jgi:hypothetical protein